MAELKRAGNKMEDQGIPRAALSEGVLTIDVDSHVETMEEQEDARWHQLLNAHRTKKILTGQLGGIERLDSGWVVAITYYNGFRILIPMDEMMINLMGDGRENSDRQELPIICSAAILILLSAIWMNRAEAWLRQEKMPC